MDEHAVRNPTFQSRGAGWLQRALFIVVSAIVIVTAFFFLTVALVAGAFLAVVIGVRWWWLLRRLRAERKTAEALEGQYTVVEDVGLRNRRLER